MNKLINKYLKQYIIVHSKFYNKSKDLSLIGWKLVEELETIFNISEEESIILISKWLKRRKYINFEETYHCILSKKTTAQEINDVFRKAAEGEMKGIIEFSTDELVSSDIVGNSHSCILDSELTSVNGNMAKIVGWYDNEAGYSGRLAELALLFGKLIKK